MIGQVDFWDGQAAAFDDEPDHGLRDPRTRQAWSELLAGLMPGAGARVLDLGCGTGTLSVLLAEQGHRVTGIDLSPKMIFLARRKAERAEVDIAFSVGDAAEPQAESGGYDVVLTRHVLWALPDPVSALGRWLALLGSGGRLILIEGRWSTGVGLTAEQVVAQVRVHGRDGDVVQLSEDRYWGAPISDERYVVVCR